MIPNCSFNNRARFVFAFGVDGALKPLLRDTEVDGVPGGCNSVEPDPSYDEIALLLLLLLLLFSVLLVLTTIGGLNPRGVDGACNWGPVADDDNDKEIGRWKPGLGVLLPWFILVVFGVDGTVDNGARNAVDGVCDVCWGVGGS